MADFSGIDIDAVNSLLGKPPAPVKAPGRTMGEVIKDTGAQLAEGVNTIAGAIPDLIAPESGVSEFFRDNAKHWQGKQSQNLQDRADAASKAIDKAGEDGVISQISEAAGQYFGDPGLAARFVVTNIPSMIPGIGAAKLAKAAALARGASEAKAIGMATTAGGAANAVLNAGGARGDSFEDIKQTLIKQGLSPEAAERQALTDSRVAAAVGGLAGFVSGKIGVENVLSGGVAKGGLKAGAGQLAKELAGEQIEEVAPKLVTNALASQYDDRGIGKDVGRTIVETGIGSAPGAAIAGGVTAAQPSAPNPAGKKANDPDAVLSRAAVNSGAAPAAPIADPIHARAGEISDLITTHGLMPNLPPDIADGVIQQMSIARNKRLPAATRQQALDILEQGIAQAREQGILPPEAPPDTNASINPQDPANAGFSASGEDHGTASHQTIEGQPQAPSSEAGGYWQLTGSDGRVLSDSRNDSNKPNSSLPSDGISSENNEAPRSMVGAPVVQIPAGEGTAQIRKRKAQLGQMLADGFDTIEQRDGRHWLVNVAKNQEMPLSGPLDAVLATNLIRSYVDAQAHEAAASPKNGLTPPTEAQIAAENYKKGHLRLNGMDIAIENPRGSTRSGTSPDGKRWETKMAHHYGYFKGTVGADKDALDVFIGAHPESDQVFVIDQANKDGSFDEHKVVFGARTEDEARLTYLANYDKGWTGLSAIKQMTVPEFKAWAKSNAAKNPASQHNTGDVTGVEDDGRGIPGREVVAGPREGGANDAGVGQGGREHILAPERVRRGVAGGASQDYRVRPYGEAELRLIRKASRALNRPSLAPADPTLPHVRALNALLDSMERLTGHRGLAISDPGERGFDGVKIGGDTVINADNPHQHVAETIAHEFKHLTEKFPSLAKLYDRLWASIPIEARRAYYDRYLGKTKKAQGKTYATATKADRELLKDEMLADFMGKRFNDRAWLQDLAKTKPNLFGQFVKDWLHILDSLIGELKSLIGINDGQGNRDKDIDRLMVGYVKELAEAKAIAMDVATQWAEQNPRLAKSTGAGEAIQLSSRIDSIDDLGNFNLDSNDEYDFDPADMADELNAELAAEIEALAAPGSVSKHDIPALEASDAEIRQHGIMAEDAYPDLDWRRAPGSGGNQLLADVPGLYVPGKMGHIELDKNQDGLWTANMRSTWVGPTMAESDGAATLKAVKAFAKRYQSASDLRARGFDLASQIDKSTQDSLLSSWRRLEMIGALEGGTGAHRFGKPGRADQSIKQIAESMGITQAYDVSVARNIEDPHHVIQQIVFKDRKESKSYEALLHESNVGGKKKFALNTSDMGKGGLGAAAYQIAAEYVVRRNGQLEPESSLSGMNTYRRTEQQISAAFRTGKSNIMTPHPTQRVYGFENDAKTTEQHANNLTRLLLASLRNAQELVPGFDKLRYDPVTAKFTDTKGKDKSSAIAKLLSDVDARAFGLGKSTIARALMTRELLSNPRAYDGVKSLAEPVLYSERLQAEMEFKAIEDQYKDTEQWLKAPNGEKSKLSPRQWVQVRTPMFKKWFGDWERAHKDGGVWATSLSVSKVVGSDGEPLVVYHGTDKGGFMAFNTPGGIKRGDLGIFTTPDYGMARSYVRKGRPQDLTPMSDDEKLAELGITIESYQGRTSSKDTEDKTLYRAVPDYGLGDDGYESMEDAIKDILDRQWDESAEERKPGIYATFVNLRNPYEHDMAGGMWDGSRNGLDQWEVYDANGDVAYTPDGKEFMSRDEAEALAQEINGTFEEASGHGESTDDVVREARSIGSDGAIIRQVIDDGGGVGFGMDPADVFVAFDPAQLKSADWNTGEFGDTDDIRFSTKIEGLNPKVAEALPGIRKVAMSLTPEERSKLRADTGEKMLAIYKSLPSASEVAAVAYAGKAKRGWYKHSTEAIQHIFGDDGWRFAGLLAAMSPQVPVESNLINALNTWKNWVAAGRPQDKSAILRIMGKSVQGNKGEDSVLGAWVPNTVQALTAPTFADLVLSGPKVDSFMRNLTGNDNEVTNDAWIANYAMIDQKLFSGNINKTGTEPGKGAGYLAMNAKVREAAKILGWSPAEVQETVWSWAMSLLEGMDRRGETRGARQMLEEGYLSDEVVAATPDFRGLFQEPRFASVLQKAGYVHQLATLPPATRDIDHGQPPFDLAKGQKLVTQAGLRLEFLQRQRRTNVQISWEARPGESTGVLPGIHNAPLEQQQAYLADVFTAIGEADFYGRTGLSLGNTLFGPSAWQGKVLAGAQTVTRPGIVANNLGGLEVDKETRKKIEVAASVLGATLKQEGVYWHYPIYKGGNASLENGIEITFGRSLTTDEMADLYGDIIKVAGHNDWAPANTSTGVRVLNFTDTPNKKFHSLINSALRKFAKRHTIDSTAVTFSSDGDAIENNWKENPNGQGYLERIRKAGRSDLLQWIDDSLRPAIEAVNHRYAEQYGWGRIQLSERDGGSDRGLRGSGESTVRGTAPRYGSAREGAVSATGYHFSKQARSSLNSAFYGSGLKGLEAERLQGSENDDIRPRVYFYVDKGRGINPEAGVGGNAHHVQMDNLYDVQQDPLGLVLGTRGMPGNRINNWERAIVEAGFDGYYQNDPVMPQAYAVLLGKAHNNVPVEPASPRRLDGSTHVNSAPAIVAKIITRQEGDELVRKPAQSEEIGVIRARAAINNVAPSFRPEYGYWRVKVSESAAADAALAEAGSTFRFGEPQFSDRQTETPEFKAWSGGAPVIRLDDDHEYKSGQSVVVEALHGTTSANLTKFKRERANIESDFGAGFYASNTPGDVAANYANTDGPDLTHRIEHLAEQIEQDEEFAGDYDEALRQARARLSDGAPNTMKLYMRFKNPVVLGGKGETYFDYIEEYDEETDDYSEPTGLLVDFINALDESGDGLDVSARDLEAAKAKIWDAAEGDGLKFSDLSKIIKEAMIDTLGVNDGAMGSHELLRQALENMGFDGIIDTTVSSKFKNMRGVNDGTAHFIAFKPTQIKSAIGNNGQFDPENPDIRFSTKETGPRMYSELSRQVDKSTMKQAPAAAWKTFIKALTQKGVKPDEIEWSGVNDWLDLQEGKVPKQAIVDFLDANGVQVEEVTLGESKSGVDEWEVVRNGPEDYDVVDGAGDVVEAGFLARSTAQEFIDSEAKKDGTKYSQYTLPGGERYREVLLTLPVKAKQNVLEARKTPYGYWEAWNHTTGESEQDGGEQEVKDYVAETSRNLAAPIATADYKSSHWDQANVLAHIRVNDRTDADGKRVLFVEELQSDWGQEGKKKGFKGKTQEDAKQFFGISDADWEKASDADREAYRLEMVEAKGRDIIPAAPFVTKTEGWLNLALKRVITMAVDGGYDRVAFVNGEQSADRYDLSKQVDRIDAKMRPNGTYDLDISTTSGQDFNRSGLDASALEDHVGKEMAKKIVEATSGSQKKARFSGLDLKVGGEGMKAFYDKIVPNAVNALLKRVGGRKLGAVSLTQNSEGWHLTPPVQTVRGMWMLKSSDYNSKGEYFESESEAQSALKERLGAMEQTGFDVTDAMREKVAGGVPMFSARVHSANPKLERWVNDVRNGRRAEPGFVVAEQPPVPAQMAGLGRSLPVVLSANMIRHLGNKGRGEDQVSAAVISKIPSMLKTPRAMIHQKGDAESFLFFLDDRSKDGAPLMVVLKRDELKSGNQSVKVTDVRTMYHKDNSMWYLLKAINDGGFVWLDDENAGRVRDFTGEGPIPYGTNGAAPPRTPSGAPQRQGVKVSQTANRTVYGSEALVKFGKGDASWRASKVDLGVSADAIKRAGDERVVFSERQTQTPEFKRWFGDSKVVDKDGNPLVVYHGTGEDIAAFDIERASNSWSAKATGVPGFYFAPTSGLANGFARARESGGSNVMPVYLSINNPISVDYAEMIGGTFERKKLEAEGFDGVKIKRDGDTWAFVAFHPTQIKSAVGNNGQFDPENPDIRFSNRATEDYLAAKNKTLTTVTPKSVLEADIDLAVQALDAAVKEIKSGNYRQLSVPIGPVPHVLRMLGAPTQMMKADASIVKKVLIDKHAKDFADVGTRDFVMAMYKPAMVLRGDVDGEFELVSDILTQDGPVIFVVKQNVQIAAGGPKVSAVMSAYARPVAGGGSTIAKRILAGKLAYADMGTAQSAVTGNRYAPKDFTDGLPQFRATPSMEGSGSTVQQTGEPVNTAQEYEPLGNGSTTGGLNSARLPKTTDSATNVSDPEKYVKPINGKYAGWRTVSTKILGDIANKKVKTDVELMGWIGKHFKGDVADAPSFSERQTRTPEFKRWWGDDNTMVNEDGSPRVLYHGTTRAAARQIGVFRPSRIGAMGSAIYLGDDKESSAGYDQGAMLQVYARGKYLTNGQWSDYVIKHGWGSAKEAAKADGWSGVYDQRFESAVAVWDPQDIKSANKNNGQFDPENPDIRYSSRATETPEFEAWFGDSKVVDADGKPLVVYHGTDKDIEVFSRKPAGKNVNHPSTQKGFFFTDNPAVANNYAVGADIKSYVAGDETGAQQIVPAYLSLQNPLVLDVASADEGDNLLVKTDLSGYDGAVFRIKAESGASANYYIAFSPAQIKSAIGNNGQFDPANPDIRFSDREPYANAPDSLMGYRKNGPQKAFGESNYKHVEFVRVTWDDGESMVEAMTGLNKPHALERARRNWKTAEIKAISRAEAEAEDPGIGDSVDNAMRKGIQLSARTSAWDAPEASRFDDVVYKLQDRHIDTKRVIESITKSVGKIADDINVYLQEELFHGRAAKRTQDFGAEELNPLMKSMADDDLSQADVEEYLHARHAKEANAVIAQRNPDNPEMHDGGSGMTDAAADAYMNGLTAEDRMKLESAARQVDAILAKTRQMYADYGLESQDTVDSWGQMFRHYIPLQREDKGQGMGIGQGFSVKGKEVKGRTGSKRKVVDILANIAMQRERLIVRGEKNRVGQALVGLAMANPNEAFWRVGPPPSERVYDPKTNTVVERVDPMYKSRENVLVAKISQPDGSVKEVGVNFNEDDPRAMRMASALKNLDAGNLEGLLGVSAKITRYFAAVNTQYNPVFGVVNLIRDVQGAMVNISSTPLAGKQTKIARDTLSALQGIYGDMRKARSGQQGTSQWAQLWEEFQKEGGQTGYRELFKTSKDRADALQNILTPEAWADTKLGKVFTANGTLKVPMSQARKSAGWIFDWLSDYNEAMENGVRLAAYKAGVDGGMTKQQAASLAKNLTVNFNRKGQVGQQAGAVYAFFNAAVQGSAKIGQVLFDMDGGDVKTLRLSKTGRAVVYGGLLMGAAQAMMLAAAGFGDDDPPEFVRERALIVPTGGKGYVSIPLPLGLHAIPGVGRHAVEFALSGFKKPAQRAADVFGMFADSFNPIGNAGMSIQTIAPTALDPLVALTENRDYTGKPIARTSSNKALPGHAQWKDTATSLSKAISEAINFLSGGNQYVAGVVSPTPDQIDYLIGQATGGVGRELSKVEQTTRAIITGEELPTHKIPLAGRFYGNTASQASQGNQFYANVNRLNELETEVKGLIKDRKPQEAAALVRQRPEAYLMAQANAAERQISQLKQQKRAMAERGESRERVRAVEERITQVMARLNAASERLTAAH